MLPKFAHVIEIANIEHQFLVAKGIRHLIDALDEFTEVDDDGVLITAEDLDEDWEDTNPFAFQNVLLGSRGAPVTFASIETSHAGDPAFSTFRTGFNAFLAALGITGKNKSKIVLKVSDKNFNLYLYHKGAADMLQSPQLPNILAAKAQHLVTIFITLQADAQATFGRRLNDTFASNNFSDVARACNEERSLVIQETLEQHLLPVGVKWTREWISEEAEEYLAWQCAQTLHEREHTKLDNLFAPENQDDFIDIIQRHRPDVIGIGGFSIATAKLARQTKGLLNSLNFQSSNDNSQGAWGEHNRSDESSSTPIIYVHDEVARLYQHSQRAEEEFSALSPLSKYCVGLARYVQNPLNEYTPLGSDIVAITFEYVLKEKLFTALERTIVDINRAVTGPLLSASTTFAVHMYRTNQDKNRRWYSSVTATPHAPMSNPWTRTQAW
ncbi:Holliday-junction resolvase-like of SPT6-domain-containing protein [Daedaleopsis nitida]|nr:Holliday-junction resolvase-like of SPT6-domain-containing protein [Daedaleopsis nitida]